MNFKIGIILAFCVISSIECYLITTEMDDFSTHPCKRDCSTNSVAKNCSYTFVVEWFTTMSKTCVNCPNNQTGCKVPYCNAANGVQRPIITINRRLPGPAVEVCEGDLIRVNVVNNLHMGEATTIHWHGFHLKKYPFMDGTSMITQCPIYQHSSFEYQFPAEPGTYFYHAHSAMQRGEGAFGALIVRQKSARNSHRKLYDYDLSEHVIVINDWTDKSFIQTFVDLVHDHGGLSPDSILINGRGVGSKGGPKTPRSVFTVKKGKRYRFRAIFSGHLICPIQLSFGGHKIQVIASDGRDIVPVSSDYLNIVSGERYDFILTANQTKGNYWILVKGLALCAPGGVFQTAILNYDGVSTDVAPVAAVPTYETAPNSASNVMNAFPGEQGTQIDDTRSTKFNFLFRNPNRIYYLGMEFKAGSPEYIFLPDAPVFPPQINGISMIMPPAPPLYQWNDIPKDMLCNYLTKKTNSAYSRCLHVLEVDLNDLVELVLFDRGPFPFSAPAHPIHLHGYSFAVLGSGLLNATYTHQELKALDKNGFLKRNFWKPPLKDTVELPIGGYTIIRFYANNPGVWLLHCHMEMHPEIGQQILFRVGKAKDLPKMPKKWPKCNSFKFIK